MDTIISLILVALFAYIGTALYRLEKLPPPLKAFVSSGIGFAFLGWILGEQVFGVLGKNTMQNLSVLLDLGLGWVGLIFGLGFNISDLKRFPWRQHAAGLAEASITIVVCLVPLLLWFQHHWPYTAPKVFTIATLCAVASVSSPTSMALVMGHLQPRGPVTDLLRLLNSIDAVPALVLVGILASSSTVHPMHLGPSTHALVWFGISCGMGLALGALSHLLTLYKYGENEMLVIMLGLVIFSGGAAHYLHLSPLFVNFISGMLMANRSPARARIASALSSVEKPIYLMMLTLSGAMWSSPTSTGWVLVVAFIGLRIAGKWLGGLSAAKIAGCRAYLPLGIGPGLFGHGAMALALALGFGQFHQGPALELMLTAVLASMFITTIGGPASVRLVLVLSGEHR